MSGNGQKRESRSSTKLHIFSPLAVARLFPRTKSILSVICFLWTLDLDNLATEVHVVIIDY
jgi:hypothetical protein